MQPHNTEQSPGFEERDVDVATVLRPALALLVLVVFSFVAMWWTFRLFDWQTTRRQTPLTPIAKSIEGELPPEPRLQTSPQSDLKEMRADEDTSLGGYAWIDRNKRSVRIPVTRAMEVLAERGLPVRPQEAE
jgi:hypothetical protein